MANLGPDWDILIEMISKGGHALIHNGGRVDLNYLNKVAERYRPKTYLGSLLLCDWNYMEPVIIELEAWAICLALRWNKHFFKKDTGGSDFILNRIIRLEDLGRWTQALSILDAALVQPRPSDKGTLIVTELNRWFCLQELGRDNDIIRREVLAWKLTDLSPIMQSICTLVDWLFLEIIMT